jgi:hypothetical protein
VFNLERWVDQGLGELCVRKDAPSPADEPCLDSSDWRFLTCVRSLATATAYYDTRFHQLFPDIPQWERLLTCTSAIPGYLRLFSQVVGYRCAYQGRILLQGDMYLTKRHLCFYSSHFGTTVSSIHQFIHVLPHSCFQQIHIPLGNITKVEKRYTAKIFPNAIAVETTGEAYLFASLMNRDETWRLLEALRSFT